MKSIIEEASSIAKAIENAWIRAGKPDVFQVKILEEPKRNFLGLTVQSAKIGFFYAYEAEALEKPSEYEIDRKKRPQRVEKQEVKKEEFKEYEKRERKPKVFWTNDMIQIAKEWLTNLLYAIGRSQVSFSIEARGYHLRIYFAVPVIEDRAKEQQLFRCLAYLIMQALRTKFKKGFAGLKVVLKGA